MSGPYDAVEAMHQGLIAARDAGRVPVKGIYDRVPSDSGDDDFPYISGPDKTISNDWLTGTPGSELSLTYHVWSRHRGSKEVLDVYHAFVAEFDGRNLDIARGQVLCNVDGGTSFEDPDGITEHGIVRVTLSHQE